MDKLIFLKQELAQKNLPALWPQKEQSWAQRRQEILRILTSHIYGRSPLPVLPSTRLLADERVLAGKAWQKRFALSLDLPLGRFTFPVTCLVPSRPAPAGGWPFFIHLAFRPEVPDRYLPAEEIIDNGFAVFNLYYQDISPDRQDDFAVGLPTFFPVDLAKPASWGKVAMWAWAASRVLDFALAQQAAGLPLDLARAAVVGHSRLGKTALWAGAQDERFQYVISNDSGCSGAALTRGKTGEDITAITSRFPYWFCPTYRAYADREDELPFDQHFLIAASAPRRVYIASAAEDSWADPQAEFLAALAASEVYQRIGLSGLVTPDSWPSDDCIRADGELAYQRRPGSHFFSRTDWQRFMAYVGKDLTSD